MLSGTSIFPHWRRKAAERSSNSSYEVPFFLNAAYYPNWRIYRKQPPSALRLGFISHIFYAFAWVKEDGTVYLSDEWADTKMPVDGTNGCLRAFAQLKPQYSKMKLILSVGGGGKGSENFALVARSQARTETFVRSARALVDQFGLDGIDVDWEYPSDPQEGSDYIRLLARLREALPTPRYVLASCLPAGPWALRNIDLAKAQLYLDLINLMAYDFSGPWESQTGHQAQLFSKHPSATSCQNAVSYVLSQGVDPKKLLLGVPAYGRSFLGSNGVGQRYVGCGGEDGVFDYSELPRPGAKEHHDSSVGAAYCVGGDGGFVTYDTPQTVQQKAKFVTKMKLGGLFYWHIGGDARGPRSLIETGYNTLHDM
ncbi:glycoside hydrolase family 18 protein [Aspergillus ibericus CBS 121593]|uniref:chitinase n=1 Tax=Aspergillus ibericus CBS 121593 TaxID=1448316 RepID=A0A395H5H1_9EURO|nr:class V chitinase [Aspergillus ibericus CBS 121593]RAL02375.1 class V chitinase [Aspergillus ibericus CBS 121593]